MISSGRRVIALSEWQQWAYSVEKLRHVKITLEIWNTVLAMR